MCGRYTLTYGDLGAVVAELDALLDPSATELYRPRFNIAPTNTAIIARPGPGHDGGDSGRPALVPAVWGLHRDHRLFINARSESASTRFPAAYRSGRCVVPADGFYEWTSHVGGDPQTPGPAGERRERRPLWFHAPPAPANDGAATLILMAGLFEEGPGGRPAFVVLTTAARPPVAAVHDRMPVLLSREGARRWILGPAPRAVVPDDVPLMGRAVSARVNAVAHDDPACLAPPEPEAGEQLGLFRRA